MRRKLVPHPERIPPLVTGIEVEAERTATGSLALHYVLTGDIFGLHLPEAGGLRRADRLWESTCFEAFIRLSGETAYRELNVSPSTDWASYRFDSYRAGMREAGAIGSLGVRAEGGHLEIRASWEPDLPGGLAWQVALSAIVEEKDGAKSYWALAHPPGAPDFHHPDCFVLELPPPVPA